MRTEKQQGRRTTIKDIAERAGVSKGAVSYALNGRPGVSEETRDRILAIADELGWYPNRAARALSASRADACGLVLARPATTIALEPFFMEFIAGVEAELSPRSIGLTIQLVRTVEEEIAIYRRWFGEHRVDGVFVVDVRHDDPRVEALSAIGLPAVVIGGPLPGTPLPSVWHDEASVVIEAVQYLAALGHRRIARVSGVAEFVHTAERTRAFNETVRALGLAGRGGRHRLHARERHARDATAALLARAADRDHLRQRPPCRHRTRRGAADGLQRPRRPLADRLGRLADQPRRAPAADRDHARHRRVRRHGGTSPARRDRRRRRARTSRSPGAS